MLRSLEESLKRLRLGRIDVVHIHDPGKHYREALEVAFPTLAELRSHGVIGGIGAGMNRWQMPLKVARHADFDCFLLAGRYTLLEQDSLPLLDFCQQKGIAIFLGGVYNTGILAVDIADEAQVAALAQKTTETYDRIDGLILTAGILPGAFMPLETFSTEIFGRVMDVNVTGTFLVVKHIVPLLKKSPRGVVILTSSGAATAGSSSCFHQATWKLR